MSRTSLRAWQPPAELPTAAWGETRTTIAVAEREADVGLYLDAATRYEARVRELGERLAETIAQPAGAADISARLRALAETILALRGRASWLHEFASGAGQSYEVTLRADPPPAADGEAAPAPVEEQCSWWMDEETPCEDVGYPSRTETGSPASLCTAHARDALASRAAMAAREALLATLAEDGYDPVSGRRTRDEIGAAQRLAVSRANALLAAMVDPRFGSDEGP